MDELDVTKAAYLIERRTKIRAAHSRISAHKETETFQLTYGSGAFVFSKSSFLVGLEHEQKAIAQELEDLGVTNNE